MQDRIQNSQEQDPDDAPADQRNIHGAHGFTVAPENGTADMCKSTEEDSLTERISGKEESQDDILPSQEGKRVVSVRNAVELSKSYEISFIDYEPQVTLFFVL